MIYLIDDNSFFSGIDSSTNIVSDLKHQTNIPIPEGTYLPAKFDFTNQKWIGSDRPADFDKVNPSPQQSFNANLMLQVATLTAEVSKLKGSAS